MIQKTSCAACSGQLSDVKANTTTSCHARLLLDNEGTQCKTWRSLLRMRGLQNGTTVHAYFNFVNEFFFSFSTESASSEFTKWRKWKERPVRKRKQVRKDFSECFVPTYVFPRKIIFFSSFLLQSLSQLIHNCNFITWFPNLLEKRDCELNRNACFSRRLFTK